MKTSNKLIALGILLCSISAISFMVTVKSSMVVKGEDEAKEMIIELEEKLSDEDKKYVEKHLGILSARTLDLNGNHRYILDPTTNKVTVTGPAHIVNSFEELSSNIFFQAHSHRKVSSEGDEQIDSEVYDRIRDTLYYNIGISDVQSLLIIVGHESKVSSSAPLQLKDFKLYLEGSSHVDAEIDCEALRIKSADNGQLTLSGTAKEVDIVIEDNSNLKCYGLAVVDSDIMLSDNSRLELGVQRNISGIVQDNAYFGNTEPINIDQLIVRNNARVDNK